MRAAFEPAPLEVRVVSLRRVRRRLARVFARGAVFFALAPVGLLMLYGVAEQLVGFAYVLFDGLLLFWLGAWLGGAPLCFLLSLWATRGARVRAAALRSLARRLPPGGSGGVRLRSPDGPFELAPEALEGALLVAGEPSVVELVLRSGDVLLAAPEDEAMSRALLEALGYGPGRRRTLVHLGGGGAHLGAGCSGIFFGILVTVFATCGVAGLASSGGFMDAVGPYLIGGTFVLASALAGRALTPGTILVGADGLFVDKPFRRRFIAANDVLRVFLRRGALCLSFRRDGEPAELELMNENEARTTAVRGRLEEALSAAAPPSEAPEDELARRGRPLAEWRQALSRLGGAVGYRGRAVPTETLLALAEDPGQSPEQRIGAALVLGQGHDLEAKARVRIAAETLANDHLRKALIAASEGGHDEEALREALAEDEQVLAPAPGRLL